MIFNDVRGRVRNLCMIVILFNIQFVALLWLLHPPRLPQTPPMTIGLIQIITPIYSPFLQDSIYISCIRMEIFNLKFRKVLKIYKEKMKIREGKKLEGNETCTFRNELNTYENEIYLEFDLICLCTRSFHNVGKSWQSFAAKFCTNMWKSGASNQLHDCIYFEICRSHQRIQVFE